MKNYRKPAGHESLPVTDARFAAYVERLVALLQSDPTESDKRAARAALKRIDDALAEGTVSFRYVDGVKKIARMLELVTD